MSYELKPRNVEAINMHHSNRGEEAANKLHPYTLVNVLQISNLTGEVVGKSLCGIPNDGYRGTLCVNEMREKDGVWYLTPISSCVTLDMQQLDELREKAHISISNWDRTDVVVLLTDLYVDGVLRPHTDQE